MRLRSRLARFIMQYIFFAYLKRYNLLLLKKMGQPRPLLCLFSVFSNKHYKCLQQIYVKKCPSSIQCWDLYPRPSECESPLITTRPRLPLTLSEKKLNLRDPLFHTFFRRWSNTFARHSWSSSYASPCRNTETRHGTVVWPDWAIFCTLGNFLKTLATIN